MNDYYKKLPKKRMGAGALIFNENKEVLIVKPNYKEYWTIPGGTVDENESPKEACIREVKEEIGIQLDSIVFLCVDYTRPVAGGRPGDRDETLQFIFYGGILDTSKISHLKIDKRELGGYRFVPVKKAEQLLGGRKRNLVKRLPKCIKAIKTGTAVYLEDGEF